MTGIDLTGRRVLVTGGTRGIGRGIVLALANAGARVVTCYHGAPDTAGEITRLLGADRVVRADVTRADDVSRLVAGCGDSVGGLDGIVNSVGSDAVDEFGQMSPQAWQAALDVNLSSAFRVTHAALTMLGPGGSVVNIGTAIASHGAAARAHYTAAKAGLTGLTRSLCKELGPRDIRVNTVAPGFVLTEPRAALPAEVLERFSRRTALRRFCSVDEMASPVLFLLSDLSRYVTGITLNVDGGL